MICYQLRCPGAHQFEGWFRSGEDFDRQAIAGLVECPACGSRAVERALMAPAVVGSAKRRRLAATGGSDPTPVAEGEVIPPERAPSVAGDIPAALRALLGRMREEIERTCDNVGGEFAETALRMHRGEEEKRGIYGETTDVEREILADEGVEIARIPWIKRAEG
jgi:hypothetical protein